MDRYLFVISLMTLLGCKQTTNQKVNESIVNEATIQSEIQILDLLLDSAKNEKKNLFLLFTFQGCSVCKIFDKYHSDPIVNKILNHYLILKKIDFYKTPGGQELYASYGKIGFPSWTIIDSTKCVLIDSGNLKDRSGNIGFPDSEKDRDYYVMAIKKAAPSITNQEREILKEKLKEYRPDKTE